MYVHIYKMPHESTWQMNKWSNAPGLPIPVYFSTYEEGLAWIPDNTLPHNEHMIVPMQTLETTLTLLNG